MNIAMIASGGDSPGMNPCIAGLVMGAYRRGHRTWCFQGGYKGIRDNDIHPLLPRDVRGWHRHGGTHVRSDRLPELKEPEEQQQLIDVLRQHEIDALIVLGGDGSFHGAKALSGLDQRINYTGIPCTIDNDIWGSDYTLGFDTALNKLTAYIADITDTAISMYPRVFLIETLGGKDGYFPKAAVEMGICDFYMNRDHPANVDAICEQICGIVESDHLGYALGAVSEFYPGLHEIMDEMQERLGMPVKYNNISYQQRGGVPTAAELMHAANFARLALNACEQGLRGKYVVFEHGRYGYHDFTEIRHKKL